LSSFHFSISRSRLLLIQANASRRWRDGISPTKTAENADLRLEFGTDHVHVRRIVVFGEQHDSVRPKIFDRWHRRRLAREYTAFGAEFQEKRLILPFFLAKTDRDTSFNR
jgi:hypothetical protein